MEAWKGDGRPTTGTTHVVAGAMMPMRTGARAPHHWGLRISPGTSSTRRSRNGTSSNTLGNQTSAYGLRTIGSPAGLAVWTMTTSSSTTSHCS
jgi:hypothetical protein